MFSGGVEDCGSVADKGVPSGVEVEVVGVDGSGGTSWSASAVADDIGASRLRTFPPRNYVVVSHVLFARARIAICEESLYRDFLIVPGGGGGGGGGAGTNVRRS